jgi:WD40 repeat protein
MVWDLLHMLSNVGSGHEDAPNWEGFGWLELHSSRPSGRVGGQHFVSALHFLPDGKRLLSASIDGTIKIWDLATSSLMADFDAGERIEACIVSADGFTVVAGGASGIPHILRLENA